MRFFRFCDKTIRASINRQGSTAQYEDASPCLYTIGHYILKEKAINKWSDCDTIRISERFLERSNDLLLEAATGGVL